MPISQHAQKFLRVIQRLDWFERDMARRRRQRPHYWLQLWYARTVTTVLLALMGTGLYSENTSEADWLQLQASLNELVEDGLVETETHKDLSLWIKLTPKGRKHE
jgi:hypothetical protein